VILGFSNPLQPLEDILTSVLTWFHDSLGLSWAWSIVALVIVVRIIIVPLTVKQIHSMQNLQVHAPEMKEIQQRWKGNKQRQNEELMKFYKENRVNPAASCLPMLVQLPVFFALYRTLRGFEKNILTLPKYANSNVDFLGLVNITESTIKSWGPLLIVVYVVSQLTSTYFMSTTMQKSQRILMMVLPIVFIPFILNFPSGLMIYWMTSNLWTTGQGLVTRTMMPKPDLTIDRRSSRTPPKDPPPSSSGGNGKQKQLPSSGGVAASGPVGPPRRVKRKRPSGGRR
jgi:YidC/Oxa1 family membrane protein insertase